MDTITFNDAMETPDEFMVSKATAPLEPLVNMTHWSFILVRRREFAGEDGRASDQEREHFYDMSEILHI